MIVKVYIQYKPNGLELSNNKIVLIKSKFKFKYY